MTSALIGWTRARLRDAGARLRFLARDERGISAVEFAMLLPLMVTLYLGGVEVSQAVSIDRKVSLAARTVADLVAQGTTITANEMTNILNAATAVATPYPSSLLKVVVSSVKIDANSVAKVSWSVATSNTTARSQNATVTMPSSLVVPNSSVIWAEVSYAYQPAIGYVITGTLTLSDQIYMRPRQQDTICYVSC